MIVYVEDGDLWLDPTVAPCPIGYLPYSDRGVDALVIRGGQGLWKCTPSTTPVNSLRSSWTSLHLDERGDIEGSSSVKYEGDAALYRLDQFRRLNKLETLDAVEDIVKMYIPGAAIDSCSLDRLDRSNLQVNMSAAYEKTAAGTRLDDRMVVRLDFPELAMVRLAEGLGGTAERRYPLWLAHSLTERDTVLLQTPAGWEVESLPDDAEAEAGYGSYRFEYITGEQIMIIREACLTVDTIEQADFKDFIDFWAEAGRRAGKQIVLAARTP
jgi:hypothetical protein